MPANSEEASSLSVSDTKKGEGAALVVLAVLSYRIWWWTGGLIMPVRVVDCTLSLVFTLHMYAGIPVPHGGNLI